VAAGGLGLDLNVPLHGNTRLGRPPDVLAWLECTEICGERHSFRPLWRERPATPDRPAKPACPFHPMAGWATLPTAPSTSHPAQQTDRACSFGKLSTPGPPRFSTPHLRHGRDRKSGLLYSAGLCTARKK